jgi:hypothetical protein
MFDMVYIITSPYLFTYIGWWVLLVIGVGAVVSSALEANFGE